MRTENVIIPTEAERRPDKTQRLVSFIGLMMSKQITELPEVDIVEIRYINFSDFLLVYSYSPRLSSGTAAVNQTQDTDFLLVSVYPFNSEEQVLVPVTENLPDRLKYS